MEINDTIYQGESFWIEIPNVTLDGVPVLLAGDVDSFTYEVFNASTGDSLIPALTGSLAPHPTTAGLWRAKIVAPAAQRITIQAIAVKGTSEGVWQKTEWVFARL